MSDSPAFLRRGDAPPAEALPPPAPSSHAVRPERDEEEADRYLQIQLWWSLIGMAAFALAILFGEPGA